MTRPVLLGDLIRDGKLLWLYCRDCLRERDVDPSTIPLPPDVPVPEIGKHMKCSACGSRDRLRRLITRLLGLGQYRDRVRLRESKKAAKSARRQKVLLEWQ
jgi:hypothetical protein